MIAPYCHGPATSGVSMEDGWSGMGGGSWEMESIVGLIQPVNWTLPIPDLRYR